MRQVFYNTGKIISKIMMIVAVGLEAVGYVSLLDLKVTRQLFNISDFCRYECIHSMV